MSFPEPKAAARRVATKPKPARPAAWLDRATGLLLCVAAGLALASATPALLRALGAPLPEIAAPAEGPPIMLPRQPPELLASPEHLFDHDPELDLDESQAREPAPHGRIGLARGPLTLHDQPALAARSLGDVQAGELVLIMREAGDWVYVLHDGDDRMLRGWAKKSEIAVR